MNKHRQTLSDEELEIERFEFHKWANFYCHRTDRDFDGNYKFETTHDIWESWQSAVASYKGRLTEQEPVAWFTEDHLTDRSATTYDPNVRDRWIAKGWPISPLYTHPCDSQMPDGTLIDEGTKEHHKATESHIPDAGKMIEHESHSLEFEVRTMVEMLEAKEWAEHCGKSDLGQRLEWAITSLHNEAQIIPKIIPDGWQPIETAPRGMVLLFCDASMPEHPVYYVGLVIRNRECIDTTQTIGFMATHWMQMPETPKYTGEGNE